MIIITVYKNNKNIFTKLKLIGHSDNSLCCNIVSSITYGVLNAIKNLNYKIKINKTNEKIVLKSIENNNDNQILFSIFLNQLETVKTKYLNKIKITYLNIN